MPGESNTCPECGGTVGEGEFCTTCMGKGAIPVTGIELYFKKTFEDFANVLDDLKEKVDEIKAVVDAL